MISQFSNPPVENRPRPFWFFNGEMARHEIRRQILEMKDKGLGGFFLCARQGLRVPYLSREWFALCRYAVDIAREQGLEVWLYDEYPYPSGMSGGRINWLHPEARHAILDIIISETECGQPASIGLGTGLPVSARAYPDRPSGTAWDQGIDLSAFLGVRHKHLIYQHTEPGESYVHNTKRFFSYGPAEALYWTPPDPGKWKIIVAMVREIDDFKYFGSYLDPANPAAVEAFRQTTYTAYQQALGDLFGSTVKGMFTDETGFHGRWPWSKEIPGWFLRQYGYDLTGHMAALVDRSYPDAARIRYQYYQCAHELLRERYHRPLSEWCAQNGIRYTTEVPSMRMANQQYSHVPGGDPCHDKLGYPFEQVIERDFHVFRSNPKVISALARQFDRRDCLVESFHSIGWTMTLQDAKWQIDRQTLMGITLHTFHAFYYTVDGITKHDAPPSQFFQNPYWAHYRLFADYCARSSRFITETDALTEVALLHPATSWWTHLRNPFQRFAYTGSCPEEEKASDQLISDWKYLCQALLFHQIDYDDLDPEVMLMGRLEQGCLAIGRARYKTLVIPPLANLECKAAEMIRQFAEGGGTVICCGLAPYEEIESAANPADFCFSRLGLAKEAYYHGRGTASLTRSRFAHVLRAPGGLRVCQAGGLLAAVVHETTPSPVEVSIPEPLCRSVIVHRRQNASGRYLMLSSQDGSSAEVQVAFRACPAAARLYELDLETGGCIRLEAERTGDNLMAAIRLSPWQSRIIALSESRVCESADKAAVTVRLVLELDHPLPVQASRWNAYRLEHMAASIDGGPEFAAKPGTFIDHLKLSGPLQASQLSISGGFGTPQKISVLYPREETCRFTFNVAEKPRAAYLLRDRMAIMGSHTIRINGQALDEQAFQPAMVYDPCNLLAEVTDCLLPGENSITVTVVASADDHGVSDPLYLLGDFGVVVKDGRFAIGAVPAEARLVSGPIYGFPFYSGTLTFCTAVQTACPPGQGHFALSLPDTANIHECIELLVNGRSLGVRAFAPYTWTGEAGLLRAGQNDVQVKLTNTLGSLLEGAYFDFKLQQVREIRPETFTLGPGQ